MAPLVSILIPAYNAREWIADTLRSALGQTWLSKEIIVVDDGSSDETLSVARAFAREGVVAAGQAHQGAAAARNHALFLSRGDYIQWLDADDLLAPDKIAKQMEAAERCPARRTLFSSCWGVFMYRINRARFRPTALWCDLSPLEWHLRKLGQNIFMQTASWLVSRELTEAAGLWDTRMLADDDGEYFSRVIMASDGIRFVPEATAFWRDVSSTRLSFIGLSEEKVRAHFISMGLQIARLRSLEESERVREGCRRYLQEFTNIAYPEHKDVLEQMSRLFEELGGQMEVPSLAWKYSVVEKVFGRALAKRLSVWLRRVRWNLMRRWDKAMFGWEKPRGAGGWAAPELLLPRQE